jgi:transcriptional repressor NrdR
VYRNFASLEDFEGEIALLRALPSNATNLDLKNADLKTVTTVTKDSKKVTTPENTNQKTGK